MPTQLEPGFHGELGDFGQVALTLGAQFLYLQNEEIGVDCLYFPSKF